MCGVILCIGHALSQERISSSLCLVCLLACLLWCLLSSVMCPFPCVVCLAYVLFVVSCIILSIEPVLCQNGIILLFPRVRALSLAFIRFLSFFVVFSLSLSLSHSQSLSPSFSFFATRTNCLSLARSRLLLSFRACSLSCAHSFSFSLSLLRTHTHTHSLFPPPLSIERSFSCARPLSRVRCLLCACSLQPFLLQ